MATTFTFICPNCKNKMRASSEYIGQRGRCPSCKALVEIKAAGGDDSVSSIAPTAASNPAAAARTDVPGWLPGAIGAIATILLYLLIFFPLATLENRQQQREDAAKNAAEAAATNAADSGEGAAAVKPPRRSLLTRLSIGQKFTQRSVIMYFETLLFCWGFAVLALKYLAVKKQLSYAELELQLIPIEIGLQITPPNVDQFLNNLNGQPPATRYSILGRRIVGALEHFKSRNNVSEVQAYLATQGEIDASAVDSGYAIVKAFIWAIPTLGFIGTVLGLSTAVGGLQGLTGAADMNKALTGAMSQLTGGLATSFDTTLVALIMSVILLFPMESLRRTEYRMLDRIEQFSNESLLRRMGDEGGSLNVEEMPQVVRDALQSAFGQHQRWLVQWQGQVSQLGQVIGGEFESAVSRIQEKLVTDEEARIKRMQDLSQVIDNLFQKTCASTETWQRHEQQSANQVQALAAATERLERSLAVAVERTVPAAAPAAAGVPEELGKQMERLEREIGRLADVLATVVPGIADASAYRTIAPSGLDGNDRAGADNRRRSIFKFWS